MPTSPKFRKDGKAVYIPKAERGEANGENNKSVGEMNHSGNTIEQKIAQAKQKGVFDTDWHTFSVDNPAL